MMPRTADRYREVAVVRKLVLLVIGIATVGTASAGEAQKKRDSMFVLDTGTFRHHVDFFNTMEPENIVNYVSNQQSWAWMTTNIPFFECPDKSFEQIYYFLTVSFSPSSSTRSATAANTIR
jgi:hypothetical protein